MILIDLQKAFDTIDHSILLDKLKSMHFSDSVVSWFRSYLTNRRFHVRVDKKVSEEGFLHCGVPQGSILGPLLFLLYVNDMPQSLNCELLLYADDSCLISQHKDIKHIENILNQNFSSLCEWFVDNKLSVHFGEDKTKSILFSSKCKANQAEPLNIVYNGVPIKQHASVNYLGCILDQTVSGETMGLKVINKINSRLRFLYRKQSFLSPKLKRTLCNALIQPHFDYACTAWYLDLNKSLKNRLQTAQNKCIRFALNLNARAPIGTDQFRSIKWLPVDMRVNQCIAAHAFKFFNLPTPNYMGEIFIRSQNPRLALRNSFLKLQPPRRNNNMGQNCLSSKGPSIWNIFSYDLKSINNYNTFKHKVKDTFLDSLLDIRHANPYRLLN